MHPSSVSKPKSTQVTVARLKVEDARAYRGVFVEALIMHPEYFAADYTEEVERSLPEIEKRITEETIFGAWHGQELIGIVSFLPQKARKRQHVGMIWNMYIKEQFRGRGVADLLFRAILDEARNRVDQVELFVAVENKRAAYFYEKFGLETYGIMPRALRVEGGDFDARMMVLKFR